MIHILIALGIFAGYIVIARIVRHNRLVREIQPFLDEIDNALRKIPKQEKDKDVVEFYVVVRCMVLNAPDVYINQMLAAEDSPKKIINLQIEKMLEYVIRGHGHTFMIPCYESTLDTLKSIRAYTPAEIAEKLKNINGFSPLAATEAFLDFTKLFNQ